MRVRGYRLAFAGSGDAQGGSTATLLAIMSDGTVPGVVYEVDAACLSALDEVYGARGYARTLIHVEEMSESRGGETVQVTTYQLPMESAHAPSAPSAAYLSRLRAAWAVQGLDTARIDYALENP